MEKINRKLIIIVSTDLPSGVWTYANNLALLMKPIFSEVMILKPSSKFEIPQGQIPMDFRGINFLFNWVRLIINRHEFSNSIVHLNGRLTIISFAPLILMYPRRFVYTFHQYIGISDRKMEKIKNKLELALALRVGLRIAVSKTLAHHLLRDYRIQSVPIANWLNEESLNVNDYCEISNKEIDFLYIGRYANEKNPSIVIEAANLILRRYSDVKFHLYGYGELYEELCYASKGNPNIAVNHVTHEATELMSKSRFFILPSLTESFGFSAVEAIASGCILLASNIQQLDEVLDGFIVFRFAPDVLSLVGAIEDILQIDEEELKKIIENNLFRVKERFGSGLALEQYSKMYAALVSERIE
ncbi:glycosyltransferase family 4 protein [Deinococcus fonticola]|uniref:glycosyltransferase family 4 protein n=1 Tax=Deinococcus fonticola TaxID=2528713 RepID=UPI001431D688|nr:glycosyltransferase family 4 protein [Deinococcus fonticola]